MVWKSISRIVLAVCLIVGAQLLGGTAQGALFSDDFNDGNANGWTTYNPLGVGSFSFPSGDSYRLQGGLAPSFPSFGPGRAGSFRNDLTLTQFEISLDLLAWQENNQFFGIVARARQIGAGTLDAYSLTYSPQWFTGTDLGRGRFAIDRFDNEITRTSLAEFRLPSIDPTHDYRLVFSGNGSQFFGKLYDLTNLVNPIGSIQATDSTYTTGVIGLFVVGSLFTNITTDVTFDNFVVSVPEPNGLNLVFSSLVALNGWRRHRSRRSGHCQ